MIIFIYTAGYIKYYPEPPPQVFPYNDAGTIQNSRQVKKPQLQKPAYKKENVKMLPNCNRIPGLCVFELR